MDGRGFRLRHVMAVTMLDQPKYDARRSRQSCTATLRPISTPVGGGNAMMSHHVVYQLVLFALVSLSIIPTVCLVAISFMTISCGYNRGEIEQHVAQ